MTHEPIDYAYHPEYPHLRAAIYPDLDPLNPLEEWDHGIQFATLPEHSRTWTDYVEPTGNGIALDIDFGNFREFWDSSWRDSWQNEHNAPTLLRYLNTNTAAWCMLRRDGYDGTLDTYDPGDIDISDADAIAYVSREEFRKWHALDAEGKPMPRGYRQTAREAIESVLSEYNSYATGDVYGIVVEWHDSEHCQGLTEDEACDPHAPEESCPAWAESDNSCWGFIGYDYATGDAAREMIAETDVPEYRPGWEDPEHSAA